MALRDWLRRLFGADPPPGSEAVLRDSDPPPAPEAAPRRDPLDEVRGLDPAAGARRAIVLLRDLDDRAASLALLRWLRELSEGDVLPPAERLSVADFFSSRGDAEAAGRVLSALAAEDGPASLSARVRLGDEAERAGDHTRALRWYELVLAVDLDHPGARERHARLARPVRAGDAGATLLAPDAVTTFGRYALQRELGRGGAGAVFLATDTRVGRPVAVKLYHPQARADRGARLRSEAQIAASVRSAHVVRVFDLHESLGAVVMEHAAGLSLRARITRHDYSVAEAEGWLRDVAAALGATHAAGWVHRDLKPGNVLLRADGRAVLTDFGLARRIGADGAAMEGTAGYVPPEVARGGVVDPRADVFAFGRLGAELLGERASAAWATLLRACVLANPAQRPRDGQSLCGALPSTAAQA